ncbi:MAG: hypothetical protein ABGW97_09705 [Christiangramia sp.]|uniref:hypothetical protein n=1 Tax=Christiangramia sp. TaxID=1931228 RepID=UPI00324235D0
MIRKLTHTKEIQSEKRQNLLFLANKAENNSLDAFLDISRKEFMNYTIEFYEVVGDLLEFLGFSKVSVTRDGDTNNRMDAIIIEKLRSIPIEIKSPREVEYVNIKSVRQALENKIVLLSRKFYPTTIDTTSLAIAYDYPNERSGVYELIDDIYNTYQLKIGVISFTSLLALFYKVNIEGKKIDLEEIYSLKGIWND